MKKRSIVEKLLMAFAAVVCYSTSFLCLYEPEMPEVVGVMLVRSVRGRMSRECRKKVLKFY